MKPGPQPVTAEKARQMFDYDPATGYFVRRGRGKYAGKNAGCFHASSGYRVIKIHSKQVLAHRLAWLWVHGEWFEDYFIDHINHNKTDNRICNLRKATNAENLANTTKIRSQSGFKGVHQQKRTKKKVTWFAIISVGGKPKYLGCCSSPEEASRRYQEEAVKLYGEFVPAE